MREEILRKIDKWQEPPPAKIARPLPKPDEHEGNAERHCFLEVRALSCCRVCMASVA